MNEQTTKAVEYVTVVIAGVLYRFKTQEEAREFMKEMRSQS